MGRRWKRVLGEASRAYAVHAPRPGYAETDPLEWWHVMGEAVQEAALRALGHALHV